MDCCYGDAIRHHRGPLRLQKQPLRPAAAVCTGTLRLQIRPHWLVHHDLWQGLEEMGSAPRAVDLSRSLEGGQGHVATDEKPAPDQGADPLHDHTDLIDVG